MITRRRFLQAGLVLGGALALDGLFFEPKRVKIERVVLKIDGLAPGFDGFKICQITDLHHGLVNGAGYIEKCVAEANGLRPDMFALTGDYVEFDKKYLPPAARLLSGLKSPHGSFAVLGNHDYYAGAAYALDVFDSYKIPLLQNAHRMIESSNAALCIAGTRDFWEDAADARAALRGVDKNIPRILLTHHPDYSESLPDNEKIDLVIAGHTHGGQVRIPVADYAPIVPSRYGRKYAGGLVTLNRPESTRVYVSRGLGTAILPVRFNCPPEITLITLVA